MMLDTLGYMNNANIEKKKKVNHYIVHDVFIICQKVQVI